MTPQLTSITIREEQCAGSLTLREDQQRVHALPVGGGVRVGPGRGRAGWGRRGCVSCAEVCDLALDRLHLLCVCAALHLEQADPVLHRLAGDAQ